MNYDHFNNCHEYFMDKILPHLENKIFYPTFSDYLREISFLKSFKWLKEGDSMNYGRIMIPFDPEKFCKTFQKNCICHNHPNKVEEGYTNVIYQLSPILHVEIRVWIWIEKERLESYGLCAGYYKQKKDFYSLSNKIYQMRRKGNSDDSNSMASLFQNSIRDSD